MRKFEEKTDCKSSINRVGIVNPDQQEKLEENPTLGTPIGKDCYKVRIAITSKGKGKSGGARMITYVRIVGQNIFLIDIYDKSEQANITDKELQLLIDLLAQ